MAVHHRTQHHIFGQDVGFGFHHQNGLCRTGHYQIQFGAVQLLLGRIQYIGIVHITHARRADGAGKRHAAQHQRGGCANHGGNIAVDFRVAGNHHRHDLDVVIEAFWEQGADGAVNQAAGQDFFFALFAFAFEEAAGDFACGIRAFEIIHGKREEVLAFFHVFIGGNGHQHHGIAHRYFHRGSGLACDFAGFQRYRLVAVLECFNVFVEHIVSPY